MCLLPATSMSVITRSQLLQDGDVEFEPESDAEEEEESDEGRTLNWGCSLVR